MSDGKKYYCFCGSNCKYETMTKEQILTAIAQAVETGSVRDVDAGFITRVKETNGGRYVTFWVGTQEQYNAIETKATNCMYIITDDTLRDDILKTLAATEAEIAALRLAMANYTADEISKSTDGSICIKRSNGIAEGWKFWTINNVPITTKANGIYVTSPKSIPMPSWLTDSLYYDCPFLTEAIVDATSDGNTPVFTMMSGEYGNQLVTFASKEAATLTVCLTMHYMWWWKENPAKKNDTATIIDFEEV